MQDIKACLEDFENFCLGNKFIPPEEFRFIDKKLSIGTVMHIGSTYFRNGEDGKHLIWIAPDEREHDLGSIENLDSTDEYPGFHRGRSLALCHEQVAAHEIIDVPYIGYATKVILADGTAGIGPNYKKALRNAALHQQLKQDFRLFSFSGIWSHLKSRA